MKAKMAMILNAVVVAAASIFVSTNTMWSHRPETPAELLKK